MKIPRCYAHGDQQDPVSYQLHGFCDSSLSGYAAVVYLRATSCASIQTAFVASKTRVSPLSQLMIPRLELLSALILSRLITTVEEALKPLVAIEKIYCWTDSTTALHWIIGTNKEWKTFVEYRVKGNKVLRTSLIMESLRGNRKSSRYPVKRHTRIKAE